jgi:hypothetical protein
MLIFILGDNLEGDYAVLTNETCSARYGMPVLSISAEDVAGDFGPGDLLHDGHNIVSCGAIVHGWASRPERTDEERDAARLFLRQWPEGPQL